MSASASDVTKKTMTDTARDCVFFGGGEGMIGPVRCFECGKVFYGSPWDRLPQLAALEDPTMDEKKVPELEELLVSQAEWVQDQNTTHDQERIMILVHLLSLEESAHSEEERDAVQTAREMGGGVQSRMYERPLVSAHLKALRKMGYTRMCCQKNIMTSMSFYNEMFELEGMNEFSPQDFKDNKKFIMDECMNSNGAIGHTVPRNTRARRYVDQKLSFTGDQIDVVTE